MLKEKGKKIFFFKFHIFNKSDHKATNKEKIERHPTFKFNDQEVAGGRKGMKITNVVLSLSSEETLRLTRILVDEDKEEAMTFLKECLKPQLDQATRDH